MGNPGRKILILFDGYESIKRPINLFDANNCDEWNDDTKVIISSTMEYLSAFENYQILFAPNHKLAELVEYRISDLNYNQIRQYIQ